MCLGRSGSLSPGGEGARARPPSASFSLPQSSCAFGLPAVSLLLPTLPGPTCLVSSSLAACSSFPPSRLDLTYWYLEGHDQ